MTLSPDPRLWKRNISREGEMIQYANSFPIKLEYKNGRI
jgi:hypothetical protein